MDSEDITFGKMKIQLSLETNTLSDTFNQNTSITDKPSETLQIPAVDSNNKSKPQLKKYCSFCHKNNHSVSTCYRRINMLKESKPQSKSPTPSFYQHSKTSSNEHDNQTPRYRSRTIVTIIEDSHENFTINPVLILVQIPAQDIIITTLLKTTLHIMIVIDLDMINITKTPHVHITLLPPIIIQPQLVVHINLTLVLANAPLAIIIPLLDAIYQHTALLLNLLLIAIEADLTLTQGIIQIPKKPTVNLTQPVPSIHHSPTTESKFEMNMYHPNTSQRSKNQANAITSSTWFVNLYIFKPPEDTSLPSKLELLFLLDSGASICVLNLPTFTILADHFLKCSETAPQNDDFRTLIIANKAEVPILFNVILTLHTSIHGSTRTLVISFAVANIKYNILGTPFFEKYVKTLDIEHMSLTFNTPHESRVNTPPFTAHKEKDYPYFPYIYTIRVKHNIF